MTIRESAKAIHIFLFSSVLTGTGTSQAAALEFSRLNACKDVSQAFVSLKQTSTNCRIATSVIEKTIRDFTVGSGVEICFLEQPPVASLSGFRCIQWSAGRSITCYRSVSAELIADYKANYVKNYSTQTSAYMEEAKKCPGSNGDASRIVETTFPLILLSVAKHEFGFNVQYGNTKPGSSMVSHGFAKTSPEISRRGPDAIEYVVFSDGMVGKPTARTTHGSWRLQVDTLPDFASQYFRALRRQGIDTYLATFDIDIQRSPRASALSKTPSLPEALSDVVASNLEDEGFKEMSDEELKRHTGKTREEMIETIFKGVAFGARNLIGSAPQIRVLTKTSGLTCTRSGRGAIGAYLFTREGQSGVAADFGSIFASVTGFGSCASSDASREYVRNLAQESKQAVLDELQGR